MLPYLRLAPTFKPFSASNMMRLISSTPRRAKPPSSTTLDAREQASNDEEDTEFRDMMTQQGNDTGPASYRQFLEEIGHRYKFASPQLWLGNKVVEFVS